MEYFLPSNPSSLSGQALNATRMDWAQFDPLGGLRGMIAVALPLGLGLALHQTQAGAIVAGGALSLGLGSFDRRSRKSLSVMILASFWMGLSALVGTLAGNGELAASVTAGLWGFGGGLLVAAETDLWFIGLKGVVALLIAGGFPSDFNAGLERSLLVFSGCVFQSFLLVLENYIGKKWREFHRKPNPTPSLNRTLKTLRGQFFFKSPALRHALRLAIALVLGEEAGRLLFSHNSYWLPLTVVIVLRPNFQQTFSRGLARVGGTLVGAGLTTLIVSLTRPRHMALALLAVGFAWLCFSFFRVNYALYAVFITAYVVFMLSLGGLPEMDVVKARILATCLGGALALLTYLAWPNPERAEG
jgi:hypothetical protein